MNFPVPVGFQRLMQSTNEIAVLVGLLERCFNQPSKRLISPYIPIGEITGGLIPYNQVLVILHRFERAEFIKMRSRGRLGTRFAVNMDVIAVAIKRGQAVIPSHEHDNLPN